ncbi:MAG: hypothetical protein U0231_00240 [Nitrospiraceae bacterium]
MYERSRVEADGETMPVNQIASQNGRRPGWYPLICGLGLSLLSGCVAQQADLKQTERELQRKIKQSTEELAQTRARQSQEIVSLREQDIPALRGDLDKAVHKAQTLEVRQDDLVAKLAAQDSKVDRRLSEGEKRSAEDNKRLGWVEKQLVDQGRVVEARSGASQGRDGRRDGSIGPTDVAPGCHTKEYSRRRPEDDRRLAQKVDGRFEEQQKAIHAAEVKQQNLAQIESQNRSITDQVSKFSQALIDFKQALGGLSERLAQEDQAVKHLPPRWSRKNNGLVKRTDALAAKIEADNKVTAEHLSGMNRSVTSVVKALEDAGGRLTSRGDEQERRFEEMGRNFAHVQSQILTLDKNLENQHSFLKQVEQHLAAQRPAWRNGPNRPGGGRGRSASAHAARAGPSPCRGTNASPGTLE